MTSEQKWYLNEIFKNEMHFFIYTSKTTMTRKWYTYAAKKLLERRKKKLNVCYIEAIHVYIYHASEVFYRVIVLTALNHTQAPR